MQLAVQNDREWRRLCDQALGRPVLAELGLTDAELSARDDAGAP